MGKGHTVVLTTPTARDRAKQLIERAPAGFVCEVTAPRRSLDQNSKLWAMLTDVSVAMPENRRHTPEDWKAIFMNACGWEVQFIEGLDGRPFPSGFRSSRMSKGQMADLINFIQEFGDQHGVRWTDQDALAA